MRQFAILELGEDCVDARRSDAGARLDAEVLDLVVVEDHRESSRALAKADLGQVLGEADLLEPVEVRVGDDVELACARIVSYVRS